MKIKYSALVSATSGKLNGSVAASNRGGAYIRNKGVTSNPQTASQQANRSMFGSISSNFRSLTESQIEAWNNAAQDFPVIDRFGDTRYLSGLALYVQLNKNLVGIGETQIANPPAKQAFPAIVSISAAVNNFAPGSMDLNVTFAETVGADFVLEVKATPSVSPSVSFLKNRYRKIDVEAGQASTTIDWNNRAAYVAVFGTPVLGEKISFECTLVSTISGERSAPFIVSTIVVSEE